MKMKKPATASRKINAHYNRSASQKMSSIKQLSPLPIQIPKENTLDFAKQPLKKDKPTTKNHLITRSTKTAPHYPPKFGD